MFLRFGAGCSIAFGLDAIVGEEMEGVVLAAEDIFNDFREEGRSENAVKRIWILCKEKRA